MTKYLGVHVIAEFWHLKMIEEKSKLKRILELASKKANNTPLKFFFYKFKPYGISAILFLKESHISIHSWPEYNYAAIDIFTCGEKSFPEKALEILKKKLKPQKVEIKILKRGKLS